MKKASLQFAESRPVLVCHKLLEFAGNKFFIRRCDHDFKLPA